MYAAIVERSNGRVFMGEVRSGKRYRRGVSTSIDGTVYEGQFSEDVRHGYGTLTRASRRYAGQWDAGMMSGAGVLSESDGGEYEGLVYSGRRSGAGIQRESDGSVYSGEFFGGERHGIGRLRRRGMVYGVWEEDASWDGGRLVRPLWDAPLAVLCRASQAADVRNPTRAETDGLAA